MGIGISKMSLPMPTGVVNLGKFLKKRPGLGVNCSWDIKPLPSLGMNLFENSANPRAPNGIIKKQHTMRENNVRDMFMIQ